jgi:hypothetical protein
MDSFCSVTCHSSAYRARAFGPCRGCVLRRRPKTRRSAAAVQQPDVTQPGFEALVVHRLRFRRRTHGQGGDRQVDQFADVPLEPVLQFQARPQRFGRRIDEGRLLHPLVVGTAVGCTGLDVRLTHSLAARRCGAVRRGGILQVGPNRPEVLLLDVEREVGPQGIGHVA